MTWDEIDARLADIASRFDQAAQSFQDAAAAGFRANQQVAPLGKKIKKAVEYR